MIDKTLDTKNLKPLQQKEFLEMKEHLNGVIRRHTQVDLKRGLRTEAEGQLESDMGPLVGESYGESPHLRIPNQEGGVKTHGSDSPAVGIRKFHPNITFGGDRGAISPRLFKLRRLLRDRISKI